MSIKFKYQNDYDKLSETCPPKYFEQLNINPCFRWVFDSIENSNNFESQFHRKPKRFLQEEDKIKCKAMGLSFFANEAAATKRYNDLIKNIGKNIEKTLGRNIAEGKLVGEDGVNGDFDEIGHFTHHSSTSSNYMVSFSISKSLI